MRQSCTDRDPLLRHPNRESSGGRLEPSSSLDKNTHGIESARLPGHFGAKLCQERILETFSGIRLKRDYSKQVVIAR